ncbi:MAG: hypothetical protein JST46_17705 [Bacteroidetes bacterium]|nr:hypothetical protein [Bacteroidota bacterium]
MKDLGREVTETSVTLADTALALFQLPPIGQAIFSVTKMASVAAEISFNKKLKRFLKNIEVTSVEERRNFKEHLEDNPEAFFRKLITALDRLDVEEKADMVGKLFIATIQFQIDVPTFNRLVYCVDRLYLQDLQNLFNKYSTGEKQSTFQREEPSQSIPALVTYGLIEEMPTSGGIPFPFPYRTTHLGNILLKYAF